MSVHRSRALGVGKRGKTEAEAPIEPRGYFKTGILCLAVLSVACLSGSRSIPIAVSRSRKPASGGEGDSEPRQE